MKAFDNFDILLELYEKRRAQLEQSEHSEQLCARLQRIEKVIGKELRKARPEH